MILYPACRKVKYFGTDTLNRTFNAVDLSTGFLVIKQVKKTSNALKSSYDETETLFQFCWAHLIREIKFLATLDDTKTYGKRLLKYVKAMFATIHRQDELTELGFKRLMNKHKRSIQKTIQRFVPEHNKATVLAKRNENTQIL